MWQSSPVSERFEVVVGVYDTPRIVLVDRHTLVAVAIKKLLEIELGLDEIGTCQDTETLLANFDTWRPALIVFYIGKPYELELECTRQLKLTHPAIKIIVLTTNENPMTAFNCLKDWASGYLLMTSAAEMVQAVRCALNGSKYMSQAFSSPRIR